jgi:sugar/nucleoside kinase (ribokinase family)
MIWRLMQGNSSVGAGDTFIAGMLFGMMEAARVEQAVQLSRSLRFANVLASLKVGREGFSDLGADVRLFHP